MSGGVGGGRIGWSGVGGWESDGGSVGRSVGVVRGVGPYVPTK